VRALIASLLMGVMVALGAIAPVAAVTRVPKVALIVGPVGPEITARYKALADDAARVARASGAQVVKAYSPNATWPAVRKAITGASIVVYLGHGNGWPSRYRDELFPPSQNGFGLNPVAGVDDSAHQYFGEASVDDVKLAPNAVVLLHHLCYASGNTEPGLPEGTVDQAVQRVDNYAAGFLRAGARAVVAEGHMGPAWYVKNLLTTKLSIEKIWNRSPNANGNTFRVASDRSPGYTARLDPTRVTSGFYRSLVSRGVTASQVRSSATGSTNGSTNGSVVIAPPAEPSLANLSLRFGELSLATLPIAATETTVTLPLSSGSPDRIPSGAKVGLRWDPVLLDAPLEPQQAVAQDPAASPDPAATPAASADPAAASPTASADPAAASPAASAVPALTYPATSPDPSASPAASASPAPSPTPSSTPTPSASPSASPSPGPETPAGYVAPRGLFTLPTDPAPDPSPVAQQRRTEVIIPTEAPAVDLVVPERIGSVVAVGKVKRAGGGIAVEAEYPDVPGLYRLVPTLHTPSGEAYDAATQGLLTPVFVRVGGSVGVAYGAPSSLSLPALTTAVLPVRIVNSGSEAWDAYVTTPPGDDEGEQLPNGRLTRLSATLTATWISATGLPVPVSSTAVLDPDIAGPGADVAVTLGIQAPEAAGDYLLLLDVVSAAHGPLSALGSAPAIIRVTVTDPIPSPTPIPPQREG
jgi:hypothetical protein